MSIAKPEALHYMSLDIPLLKLIDESKGFAGNFLLVHIIRLRKVFFLELWLATSLMGGSLTGKGCKTSDTYV